jgi:hypothetical protein
LCGEIARRFCPALRKDDAMSNLLKNNESTGRIKELAA